MLTVQKRESEDWRKKYDKLLLEIKENPEMMDKPRWYTNIARTFTRTKRGYKVMDRFELEKIQPKMPVKVHVLRIGDIVIATNPFELYLDYGVRIKGRSPAVQTFVVQLSDGYNGYLPTKRSVAGGCIWSCPGKY